MKESPGADANSTRLFRTLVEWEQWLETHAGEAEVWVRIAKKGSGETCISQAEAIEGALCHGWIDGQKRALDAKFFILRFTPRRPRSLWSKINVDKVERLVAEGRMRPAGIRQVDMAKADGPGLDEAADWWNFGVVTFTAGDNSGRSMEVKDFASGVVTLFDALPYLPAASDTFTIARGCDKSSTTCNSTFANLANHRGFPFVPGPDFLLQRGTRPGQVF